MKWYTIWSIHELAIKWRSVKNWENEYEKEKRLAELKKTKKGIKRIDKELMKAILSKKEIGMMKKRYGSIDKEEAVIDLEELRARIDEMCVDAYEDIFFLSKLIVSTY